MIARYSSILFLVFFVMSSCKKSFLKEDTRFFYMGATPFPPDFTPKGNSLAYEFINKECDIACHHFDDGVPWQEALESKSLPEEIVIAFNERLNKTRLANIFVATTPLAQNRTHIAKYWKKNVNDSIKSRWEHAQLNDTLTVKAYYNYCCTVIDYFKPNYFNYAIESNSKDWKDEDFEKFVTFCSQVYSKLKSTYPKLPIFLSSMVTMDEIMLTRAKRLSPFSDQISVSAYPYVNTGSFANGSTDITNIPKDYFTKYREIDLNKPFSIAETGYIAEDLDMKEYGITRIGNKQWQAEYVDYICEIANKFNAEFITWFCPYDYDNGFNTLSATGGNIPAFKQWKDTGLYDGEGLPRPSLSIWRKWLRAKKIN